MQQRHLITKKVGRAYPRVHAVVYSVSDGILKELELDEASMFQKYSSVYNLFPEATKKSLAERAAPAKVEPMLDENEDSDGDVAKSPVSSSADKKACAKTGCDCGMKH